VLVPASSDQRTRRPPPVLCFLHGHGEARTGGHPLGPAAHRSLAYHALRGSTFTRHFLVVCPQREVPGRWTAGDAEGLHELLDRVIADHHGDEHRILLTGFSYGGDAVLKLPTYPRGDRFRKLWAVDPAVDHETPPLPPNGPVLIHYGEPFADRIGQLLENWSHRGSPGEVWVKDTQLEHVATCIAAYEDADAYQWLER